MRAWSPFCSAVFATVGDFGTSGRESVLACPAAQTIRLATKSAFRSPCILHLFLDEASPRRWANDRAASDSLLITSTPVEARHFPLTTLHPLLHRFAARLNHEKWAAKTLSVSFPKACRRPGG